MSEAKKRFFANGGRPWNKSETHFKCLKCSKKFKVIPSRLEVAKFCSIKCAKGHNVFDKGNVPWNKGKSHLRGSKHWNWRGGVDKEHTRIKQTKEYKEWRASVYKRDKWSCQKCGSKKGIVAHHIKPFSTFPNLRFVVSNGQTLCRKCHQDIHRPRRKNYKDNPIHHAHI